MHYWLDEIITAMGTKSMQLIKEIEKVNAKEGSLIQLNPLINDENTGTNSITLSYNRPFDKNGRWQTKAGDAGKYKTTVTASDGKLSDSKTVEIEVSPLKKKLMVKDIKILIVFALFVAVLFAFFIYMIYSKYQPHTRDFWAEGEDSNKANYNRGEAYESFPFAIDPNNTPPEQIYMLSQQYGAQVCNMTRNNAVAATCEQYYWSAKAIEKENPDLCNMISNKSYVTECIERTAIIAVTAKYISEKSVGRKDALPSNIDLCNKIENKDYYYYCTHPDKAIEDNVFKVRSEIE